MTAVVVWAPMGKRKLHVGDEPKALGRNELVVSFMEELVGIIMVKRGKEKKIVRADRKYVSSHVQTLQNHFKVPNVEGPPQNFDDGKLQYLEGVSG